jgi:hypothetical protein
MVCCTGGCSSAWLECRTVTAEVAGSSPVSPAPGSTGTPFALADGVFFLKDPSQDTR